MERRIYDLYLDVYDRVEEALHRNDEATLRRICSEAAARDGAASVVAMVALGDVEHGREKRPRPEVLSMLIQHLDR